MDNKGKSIHLKKTSTTKVLSQKVIYSLCLCNYCIHIFNVYN